MLRKISRQCCNSLQLQYSTSAAAAVQKKVNKQPLITCKKVEFNLYSSDPIVDRKFGSIPLASSGWKHRKSKGDYFIIHPQKDEYVSKDEWGREFKEFELDERLLRNVNDCGLYNSTWVQDKSFEPIMKMEHVLMAAETGCGKTVAYLLPIIQNLIKLKESVGNREFNTPLALILTPGRELAEQIAEVCKDLCEGLGINIKTVVGGHTRPLMLHPSFEDFDILIGTIGVISKLTTTGIYRMNECRHVVLDEADTLLEDSFGVKMKYFLRRFPFYKNQLMSLGSHIIGTQIVLASATLPTNTEEAFQSFLNPETIVRVESRNLHRLLTHVSQRFLRMNKSDRPLQLLSIVKQEKQPVIVFSNKSATADFVSIFLNEHNVNCINLNGDMLMKVRQGKFKQFQEGEMNVLSTTDLASRGLDTFRVRHVINFDFPLYISDYIHRCGRTGRVRGFDKCMITNFISSARETDTVNQIEHAARTGCELPNVDANINRIIYKKIIKNEGNAEDE